MSFSRPSLADLAEQIDADVALSVTGAAHTLPRSLLSVLARAQAGAVHGLYGYLAWMADQLFPDTAEAEHLDRHAAVWGLSRTAATPAVGTVKLTATNGAVVPALTVLRHAASGGERRYLVSAEATASGGFVTVGVEAEDAGAAGNLAVGASLSLVSALAGVDGTGTVQAAGDGSGLSGGADAETDTALLARLLDRIQAPPHGGNANDYQAWALAVSGVTRAWVYPLEQGAGTVVVRVMSDGLTADGIPAEATVTAVQTAIDAQRPVTAAVTVVAPLAVPLTVTISGLAPNTSSVRAAIEAELQDFITREAEPGGTLRISRLRAAISAAAGESDHTLVAPLADVAHATGQIATFGGVTWI